jgi:nucleoside-diphosphate-sugar epimerase
MAARGPVLALVRTAASAEALLREGIPTLPADFEREGGAWSLVVPLDLSCVVYLAPPSGSGAEDLRLAAFLKALDAARPQALLYVSTTGVYGDTGGAPVDEESPTAPGEARSRQRLNAEGRAAQWCGERGVRCVVLRVPAIYGPFRLPLERLQRSEPVLRDEDSGPGNRIHVDDLVEACLAALARPVAGVFNLTDGRHESMAGFLAQVAALAGLPAPSQVSWAEAQTSLPPGLLAFLRESRRVTSRRAQELGWTPRYGHPGDGIRASLQEMGWVKPSGAGDQ